MIMTKELADQLLETLMCVALSATGGIDDPENLDEEQMEFAREYAKETFCALLEEWETATNSKWEIEIEEV